MVGRNGRIGRTEGGERIGRGYWEGLEGAEEEEGDGKRKKRRRKGKERNRGMRRREERLGEKKKSIR